MDQILKYASESRLEQIVEEKCDKWEYEGIPYPDILGLKLSSKPERYLSSDLAVKVVRDDNVSWFLRNVDPLLVISQLYDMSDPVEVSWQAVRGSDTVSDLVDSVAKDFVAGFLDDLAGRLYNYVEGNLAAGYEDF